MHHSQGALKFDAQISPPLNFIFKAIAAFWIEGLVRLFGPSKKCFQIWCIFMKLLPFWQLLGTLIIAIILYAIMPVRFRPCCLSLPLSNSLLTKRFAQSFFIQWFTTMNWINDTNIQWFLYSINYDACHLVQALIRP